MKGESSPGVLAIESGLDDGVAPGEAVKTRSRVRKWRRAADRTVFAGRGPVLGLPGKAEYMTWAGWRCR